LGRPARSSSALNHCASSQKALDKSSACHPLSYANYVGQASIRSLFSGCVFVG
jgi:hypothetical protein